MDVLQTALEFKRAGIFPARVKIDGSKAPDEGLWRDKLSLPTEEDIHRAFEDAWGVGVFEGRRSGMLEMLEFEGRAIEEGIWEEIQTRMDTAGLTKLWDKLCGGYKERSPSGGIHLLYFVADGEICGNRRLASREAEERELNEKERETKRNKPGKIFTRPLIETRGEGGFTVVAPSHGTTHNSGQPWVLEKGGIKSIPRISMKDRNKIWAICRLVNRVMRSGIGRSVRAGVPETEWERVTEWSSILEPHGWTFVSEQENGVQYWAHAGHTAGHSATIGAGKIPDRLYVFSTSTEFEEERFYSKAEAIAVLEYAGDTEEARAVLGLRARKPAVVVNGRDESELIDEIAWHMAEANRETPIWFQYGAGYAEINKGQFQMISADTIGYLASQAMKFIVMKDQEDGSIAAPPERILKGMVNGHRLILPDVFGIKRVPFFTETGVLWQTEGICEEATIYYIPELKLPRIAVTEDLVRTSMLFIKNWVKDFPFKTEADFAAFMSYILQPFVRTLIHGPTPMYSFEAPTERTGKTLLASIGSTIAHGHGSVTGWPDKEYDVRQELLTLFDCGAEYVIFDNVYRLGSGAFAAALTSYPNYKGRRLGGTTVIDVPNLLTYAITNNNAEFTKEEVGRMVRVRLDAGMENPELDRTFDIEDIRLWTLDNRLRLIVSCLVLLQDWVDHGMPLSKIRLGGFESWAAVMGGICGHLGLEHPMGDRKALIESNDAETGSWHAFIEAWKYKLANSVERGNYTQPTASQLLILLNQTEINLPISGKDDRGMAMSLGKLLASKRDKVISGCKIVKLPPQRGVIRYKLVEDSVSGDGGLVVDL